MTAPSKPISALVVDDEAPARRRIATMLSKDRDFGTVWNAENGAVAIEMVREHRPDVVFLDVQMPGVGGFGVVEAIGPEVMPLTVLVTAYDRYAVNAFEISAVDYLLKPFGDRRFQAPTERVKTQLSARLSSATGANGFGPEFLELLAARHRPGQIWEWISVRSRDTTRLVLTQDIDWIEAAGVYVTVHAKGEEFLYRASLAAVTGRLDPFSFVRIHRSSIVNIRSIVSLERKSHGEFEVKLKDGTLLAMSRTYRKEVESVLGQPL